MSDHLETIRARWDGVAWAYEAEQEGSYIANAILTNHLDQIVIDLDEPTEDERAWLQQCAAAPGDVRALLAELAQLRAALAWYADEGNYDSFGAPGVNLGIGDWHNDGGARARAALETGRASE